MSNREMELSYPPSPSSSAPLPSCNELGGSNTMPVPYFETASAGQVTRKDEKRPVLSASRKYTTTKVEASECPEREMYASERQDNFRWLSKLVGSYADCEPLESSQLVPEETKQRVDEIGQYSELVYSYVPVESLFKHHNSLKEERILLEYQAVLSDCEFLRYIEGERTNLSAFVAYRRSTRQLVVSISGSTRFKHMKYNLHATHTPWPGSALQPCDGLLAENDASGLTVHSGFLQLYQDVERGLKEALQNAIHDHNPEELIITGHSMGGSVSHLLCMDLLSETSEMKLPEKVCLATYGTPRTGSMALVQHYRSLIEAFRSKGGTTFEEFSVKAYNDGVPAVPPRTFGYAHFSDKPLYAFQRRLYYVPLGNEESSLFHVEPTEDPSELTESVDHANRFSKGGHNYYNGRDLEGFRKTTDRLNAAGFPDNQMWREKFRKGVKKREVTRKGSVDLGAGTPP